MKGNDWAIIEKFYIFPFIEFIVFKFYLSMLFQYNIFIISFVVWFLLIVLISPTLFYTIVESFPSFFIFFVVSMESSLIEMMR